MKTREMPLLIAEMPALRGDHLVDAVAELIAAILDVHGRLTVRQGLAGGIGDAGHRAARAPVSPQSGRSLPNTPSDLSLRWRAERSMPTKAAVREMLPPKRVTCANRYSRSNTSRASRKGKVMISLPLSHLTTVGAIAVISLGSMSACTASSPSPGAMIKSQSITLRSCRTLPGQV